MFIYSLVPSTCILILSYLSYFLFPGVPASLCIDSFLSSCMIDFGCLIIHSPASGHPIPRIASFWGIYSFPSPQAFQSIVFILFVESCSIPVIHLFISPQTIKCRVLINCLLYCLTSRVFSYSFPTVLRCCNHSFIS